MLFFLGHPAHFHLLKNVINNFRKNYTVLIVIVTKDILEDLVKSEKWSYTNIFPEGRRIFNLPILVSTALNFIRTIIRLHSYVKKNRPALLIGTEGTLPHVGLLNGIPSYILNEDDTSVTPENYIVYPLATKILVPAPVDYGMWGKKRVSYEGYHELAYLHPNHFRPQRRIVEKYYRKVKRFFIIRLAQLKASHDIGQKGIPLSLLVATIQMLEKRGRVLITSESKLIPELEKYQLTIPPHAIHHFLYYADLFIGDSQTMTLESGLLGTPAIRINSFADKCSVILELENKYGLVFSFFPHQQNDIQNQIRKIVSNPMTRSLWRQKRRILLKDKIDVSAYLECYFESRIKKTIQSDSQLK